MSNLALSPLVWADDAKAVLIGYANQLHLDTAKFSACLADEGVKAGIDKAWQTGVAAKILATPSLFIQGKRSPLDPQKVRSEIQDVLKGH